MHARCRPSTSLYPAGRALVLLGIELSTTASYSSRVILFPSMCSTKCYKTLIVNSWTHEIYVDSFSSKRSFRVFHPYDTVYRSDFSVFWYSCFLWRLYTLVMSNVYYLVARSFTKIVMVFVWPLWWCICWLGFKMLHKIIKHLCLFPRISQSLRIRVWSILRQSKCCGLSEALERDLLIRLL